MGKKNSKEPQELALISVDETDLDGTSSISYIYNFLIGKNCRSVISSPVLHTESPEYNLWHKWSLVVLIFRLFSNGGNFSPEELDQFVKRLQKETGRIDFVEGLIMIDMEKMESNYLEQVVRMLGTFLEMSDFRKSNCCADFLPPLFTPRLRM